MDSLYRGYPSGAILLWETNEEVPLQDFAVSQQSNPYQNTQLLLDGQQRLTSLSAVIRGEPVTVRGRKKPLELLFNLEHPDHLAVVTEVNEDSDDDEENPDEEDADASEDELQKRFNKMVFVVATKKLEQLPQWVKVTDVFKSDSDGEALKRAGVTGFEDPRYDKYSKRLARLRGIKKSNGRAGADAFLRRSDGNLCPGQLARSETPQFRLGARSDHCQVARCSQDISGSPTFLRATRL
jgi:hypothetical protein